MINEAFDVSVCTYLLSFQEDLIRAIVTEIPLYLCQMLQCIEAFWRYKTYLYYYVRFCHLFLQQCQLSTDGKWVQLRESWRDSLSQEADSTRMFTHMMSCLCSKAWIFPLSEVFYFLKYALWPSWQQSLCNLVFVFHTKEH